jgi:hypothetical protein
MPDRQDRWKLFVMTKILQFHKNRPMAPTIKIALAADITETASPAWSFFSQKPPHCNLKKLNLFASVSCHGLKY